MHGQRLGNLAEMTEEHANPHLPSRNRPPLRGGIGIPPAKTSTGGNRLAAAPVGRSGAIQPDKAEGEAAVRLSLLLVDDDLPVLKACGEIAAGMGFDVRAVASASEARAHILSHSPDVVLMDLKMPAGGLSLLEEIRSRRPRSSIVVMTAFATVTSAIEAMRIGATDYLTKPFAMDELTGVLERAGQHRTFELESSRIQRQIKSEKDGLLLGVSPEMAKLHRIVQKVAPANHPVLILGESGTGKEAVGRAIHNSGPHASRKFTMLECGQLSPAVLESELFGYARNPNTGESRAKQGALVAEEGGTLLLSSVDELPGELQSKLLRALQDKRVKPAGAEQAVPVTVRVLAASSRNLSTLVDGGAFRKDLFYRLNVVSLRIPALRERRDDIPVLAEFFLERMRRESAVQHRFAVEAMSLMMTYDWPGNIRELESVIESTCASSSGPILHVGDLPQGMRDLAAPRSSAREVTRVDARGLPPHESVAGRPAVDRRAPAPIVSIAELEREAILHTIRQLRGDKLMAAKLLGIGKTTLYRKLKEYGITE